MNWKILNFALNMFFLVFTYTGETLDIWANKPTYLQYHHVNFKTLNITGLCCHLAYYAQTVTVSLFVTRLSPNKQLAY